MNLSRFFKKRKRKKQREKEFENAIRKTAILHMRLADFEVFNAVKEARLEDYLHERKHVEYSR